MKSVKHTFHINASFDKVNSALSSINGLSNWWTTETSGSTGVNEIIVFKFGDLATMEMKVIDHKINEFVKWKNISGNPFWGGTTIQFRLKENDNKVQVQFIHDGFQDDYDDLPNINFSWGRYLVSLRDYCEHGKGAPFS